jgi:hypothetical protein
MKHFAHEPPQSKEPEFHGIHAQSLLVPLTMKKSSEDHDRKCVRTCSGRLHAGHAQNGEVG